MTLPGFPPELTSVDAESRAVLLELDDTLYPLPAVYGAAYIFIDRAYVLLDRPSPGKLRVTLAAKKGELDDEAVRSLVGEFTNELLSCAWRHRITQDNRVILEQVTMQAIGGAMGPPSLDELADFDFSSETFEDPLGIAMSWEEKYKKKPAVSEPDGRVDGKPAPDGEGAK